MAVESNVELKDFLMTVDGASEPRVDAVMHIFAQDKVDITCYADLIGTSRDDVVAKSVMEVKVGTSGFIQRAFVKASKQDQLAQLQLSFRPSPPHKASQLA